MSRKTEEWVRTQYRAAYCDKNGKLIAPKVDLDAFRAALKAQRPEEVNEVKKAVRHLDQEICSDICRNFPIDTQGSFHDPHVVLAKLVEKRPDLVDLKRRQMILERMEAKNRAAMCSQGLPRDRVAKAAVHAGSSPKSKKSPVEERISAPIKDLELYEWIRSRYLDSAFTAAGFIGWANFQKTLQPERPQDFNRLKSAIRYLRTLGHPHGLKHPDKVVQEQSSLRKQLAGSYEPTQSRITNKRSEAAPSVNVISGSSAARPPKFNFTASGSKAPAPTSSCLARSPGAPTRYLSVNSDQLSKNLERIHVEDKISRSDTASSLSEDSGSSMCNGSCDAKSSNTDISRTPTPEFTLYSHLLAGKNRSSKVGGTTGGHKRDVEQAPLFSGDIVAQHAHDLVPQYGLLGCLSGQDVSQPASQMFLNTNAPLSVFICGVQGSGKSHATSCILENATIASPHLGQLKSPVSTLVFSYGEWSSGGAGFTISEATFLSASSDAFPGHAVPRITVLISPSNPAIKRMYNFKNTRIIPFKLKAKTLDISALRTLMAVDEKANVPLYMAKVEAILRSIAAESMDGCLDYKKFKQKLALESFNPDQSNMLEMRLNLLESYLDLTDMAPQPDFVPGEVTIVDLSDAFISPNTACVMFKLCLERFLQCGTPGKLVVLDEAHKYMLNTPGSKILTEYLTRVIRLQRHLGARMIISTQEPTVSVDLIALCSITIMHRFTSPAWYAALRKHINVMDDDQEIMYKIEGLETGEAFVYAPNAVLGKTDEGTLVKATGQLLRLNIRNRVTRDGGESIMAT